MQWFALVQFYIDAASTPGCAQHTSCMRLFPAVDILSIEENIQPLIQDSAWDLFVVAFWGYSRQDFINPKLVL